METTTDIFQTIEKTYLTRCSDTSHARTVWKDTMGKYPPEKLVKFSRRPSLDLARLSGDLALALLWGTQATLIHPLVKTAIEHETNKTTLGFLEAISSDSIGALAIVEDKNNPVTITTKNGKLILNGKKKYITGGTHADFILLTEKNTSDKKISGIIFLKTKDVPESAFQPLDMGCLKTSRHASLTFSEFIIPSENRLSLPPRTIRKTLKIWGMIEQSLIMESVTGLCLYLASRIEAENGIQFSAVDDVESKLQQLSSEIAQQIKSAVKVELIEPTQLIKEPLNKLLSEIKPYKKKRSENLLQRVKDIEFFL